MNYRLPSNVALITGAAAGLGRVLALSLAKRGVSTALLDIDASGLSETARQIRNVGVPCCTIAANLTDRDTPQEAVLRTVGEFGRLNVLINNAAMASVRSLLEVTAPEWDRVFSVNVTGSFVMLQSAARHMKASGGGRIVNISSPASRMALPNYAAYAASKAAVDSLTRSAAVALAPFGILVNSVAPGMMDTEMQRSLEKQFAALEGRGDFDSFLAERTQRIPLGRRANLQEIADTVVWLALDASSYITAARFNVSGGLDRD
jgi:NAD(P)-dependent dehydrogenase (short-subunit alcohol dehydrogenase family)